MKVALITVLYNNRDDLQGYFDSLNQSTYPIDQLVVYLYDNASHDGSFEKAESLSKSARYRTVIQKGDKNLGFVGANNKIFEQVKKEGFEYAFLLNPDTEVASQAISQLAEIAVIEKCAVQPLILSLPDKSIINTTGNLCHYLGFSMVTNNGKALEEVKTLNEELVTVSGAAFFLPTDAIRSDEPLFDPVLFAYHEDVELSWRLKLQGYKLKLAPDAHIFHRYHYGKGSFKYFLIERNRIRVLLTHYSAKTLLCIAPFFILTELFVFAQSLLGGWIHKKIISWVDVIRLFPNTLKRRSYVQSLRKIDDGHIFKKLSDVLIFPETTPCVIKFFYNPISILYKKMISPLLTF